MRKISKNENLLHHNEVGAIIQCKGCNRIAIIIQSILYTCDEEEYDYLFELIMDIDLNIEKFLFEIGDKKLCDFKYQNRKLKHGI